MLALIAGTVSYLHMHLRVELHGQPGWVAALTPLSVDGMIVAASTTLLAESRSGHRGSVLPWELLVAGSAASLAANVAVAEPTATGRVIAAWPSFALIASYELSDAAGPPCLRGRRIPAAVRWHPRAASKQFIGGSTRCSAAGCRETVGCALPKISGGGVAVGPGQPDRRRLASLGPGYREPLRPSRAVGPAGQALRTGRPAGPADLAPVSVSHPNRAQIADYWPLAPKE
jgi:hypothetical protein